MKTQHVHRHVKGHQDDGIERFRLGFKAQLNCYCDELAKGAVTGVVIQQDRRGTDVRQVLSLERARVYFGDRKQTTDMAKSLCYHVNQARAR